jgi:hypothetical protein
MTFQSLSSVVASTRAKLYSTERKLDRRWYKIIVHDYCGSAKLRITATEINGSPLTVRGKKLVWDVAYGAFIDAEMIKPGPLAGYLP